jgi:hypothetical protein
MTLLKSIPDFIRDEPFGRTQTYKLIDAGALETVYVGKRRFIVAESYRQYVEKLRKEGDGQSRPSPNPRARSYQPGGHAPAEDGTR